MSEKEREYKGRKRKKKGEGRQLSRLHWGGGAGEHLGQTGGQ